MTGKSPPADRVMSWASYVASRIAVLGLCLGMGTSGCSTFSAKRGSLTDYEATRQAIEDPQAAYRPEGASAEDEGRGLASDLLDWMGLQPKRRRDIEAARTHYAEADELFAAAKSLEGRERREGFRAAAEQYRLAAKNWQNSGLEQDALLMAAESHFFAEDYYRAESLYADLVKEYPRNPYLDHVDSRRFEIADYWLNFEQAKPTPFLFVNMTDNRRPWNDTGGHGKRVLESLRLDNPTGKLGDDTTMRLAMEHYENGRYEAAADTFADLRMTYPDSEHQFHAQFLEMQSLLASYQGPDYSSVPITDAQKRVEQITRQFPQQAAEHREEMQVAHARIRFSMAERIWKQARYRRLRSENGAARFHYQRILDQYADTPFAERARAALEEIKDAPGDPPQRFKALVWLFGSTTDERPWREQLNVSSE